MVTSSLSILASFGVPLCHKYFLHQRSVRHLVPIQYCALHQKRKWRGVEGKAEGMKPLKILHEFTHILTKKRSQYGRGVIIILLMILCTHYISYTTDTNISYIALQTKLGLGESEISNILAIGLVICGVGNLLLMAVIHFSDISVMVVRLISCLIDLGYYFE